MKKHALLLPLLLALPGLAAAQVYRTVDADGRVHYSQTPPASGKVEKVTPRVMPPSAGGNSGMSEFAAELDKRREVKAGEDQKAAAEAAQKKQKQDSCDLARKDLAFLSENAPTRIGSVNAETGKMERWTVERYDQSKKQAQELADRDCEKTP
ncbi:DUF4124 domain-containing protein [Solimonas sp. K1W22B-7]|uniref:DUF4124 domain-containing protein n=1 Tax=Solimonas sp. K1W22B-7 TaxID=2303331 RepID=UPI0013C47369|nr:DUF4124 domain-containing protein [Solimonas sp. K1W22B-7]